MTVEEVREKYLHLLFRYTAEQDERYLLQISDLGQELVRSGVPIEEVAELHEAALDLPSHDMVDADKADTSRPFMELMVSYGLEFRRQVEAKAKAEKALRKANERLSRNLRDLEIYRRIVQALPSGISVLSLGDSRDSGSVEAILENPVAQAGREIFEQQAFYSEFSAGDSSARKRSLSEMAIELRGLDEPVDLGVSILEDELGEEIHLHTRAFPLPDEHVGFHVEDVTESRRLESQLQQAQKMEVVGRLAGGIAHDFNNVLTTIFGFAEFAAEQLDENSSAHKDVRQVLHAADRAAALTRQMLSFSRRKGVPRVLDPNSQIRDIESMIRSLLEADVEYSSEYSDDIGSVRMDPGALEQVIINLVINARDALSTSGKISVKTENLKVLNTEGSASEALKPGDYVSLTVSDNGIGMSADLQKRIFDPFFTTKESGKGTGLGLYICSDLVQRAGGVIDLESEVGQGASFRVLLPRIRKRLESSQKSIASQRIFGSGTILLVEDDEGVRRSTARALREHGYHVLPAANGEKALEICKANLDTIDLLLTDLVMPSMNGQQLANHFTTLLPGAKVLLMSGYTGESLDQLGIDGPHKDLIQKPFSVEELLRKVRETLIAKTDF